MTDDFLPPIPNNEIQDEPQSEELKSLLAELPIGTRTRISLARDLGDDEMIDTPTAAALGWGELRRVVELGGFVVTGPIPPAEIARRYGAGDFRITAYSFDPPGVRWEVFARIERDAERAALAAVAELPPVVPVAASLSPAPAPACAEQPAGVVEPPAVVPSIEAPPVATAIAPVAAVAPIDTASATAEADDAAPWGDGSAPRPVLGGRGLRAELAAATLPPSSEAPRPAASLDALPGEWGDLLAVSAPRLREPDPPGLSAEVAHLLAELRARLVSIPPVVGPALVALNERAAALARGEVRVLDPRAPVWKAARKRLTSDYERDVFDRFLLAEETRRWLSMGGGNDPGAVVDALRAMLAMSVVHEIEKQRGPAGDGARRREEG